MTPALVQAFLRRRRPYPNKPWQRWLGLSRGGPARRMKENSEHATVVAWLLGVLVVAGFLMMLLGYVPRFTVGEPLARGFATGASLYILYDLLVLCSAGFLLPRQIQQLHRLLERDTRLAHACARWMQEDPVLRTRDLWRLRIAAVLFAWADRVPRAAEQELTAFLAEHACLRATAPPLPPDLSPAELAKVQASLPKCVRATPVRTGMLGAGLNVLRPLALRQFADLWAPASRLDRWWVAASLAVQFLGLGLWRYHVPRAPLEPMESVLSVWIGCLLVNALLLAMPLLRMHPQEHLVRRCVKEAGQSPWLAWVLVQRCEDATTTSSRDLVAVLRSQTVFKHYHARKRFELVASAYQSRLDSLPLRGAIQSRVEAEILQEATPTSETLGPTRRL